MKRYAFGVSLASLVVASGMWATPVSAQEAEQATVLDEIVVTAQRREENLQDVPIAVTAFDSETLERTSANGIQDIAGKAPGVTLTQFNIGEPQLYIRGVGTTSDSAASDPSIGISIDEVSIGRAGASSLSFLDIERVEILRGPQGTLYGRNASGGALNVYTRKPEFETYGSATARVGSFEEFGVEGVFNGQFSEDAAGRIAFRYNTNDGYAENAVTGASLEGGTQWGVRGQILANVGQWSFLAGADFSQDNMDGHARIPVTTSSTAPAFAALIAALRTGLDERESFSSPFNYQDRDNWGLTFRATREGESFDFVSLSSYRSNDYRWRDNLGGLPFPGFPLAVDDEAAEESEQFSQEFRIVSKPDSPINWVAGVYFLREDVQRAERFQVAAALPIAPPSFGGDVSFFQDATNTSAAVFGQATIPFAEIWEFTAGLRWSHDNREVVQQAVDNDTAGPLPPGIPLGPGGSPYLVTAEEDFSEPTWRLALAVEPVDAMRFYVSYDRGYKAGAFVSAAQTAVQAGRPIRSEILDNYAIGAKTTLFGRWRLNAEAFLLDYKDLQVYELLGLTLVTSNADAEVKGFEIETAFAVTPNITIGGSYTHLDAQYESNATSGALVLPYQGNTLPRSPDSQYTLYADGEWETGSGTIAARIDYQWTDAFYFDPSNNPEVLEDEHGLLSAYASWESANGLKVSLYGKNLTDEEYRVHIIKNVGIGFSVFGPPRNWGVSVTKRF